MRHYVLEYFRDVWNVWLKAKTTKDCQVAVDDLIPGSRYCRILSIVPLPAPTNQTGAYYFVVKVSFGRKRFGIHSLTFTAHTCRYKFRVKSENDYGISEPGEESDPFDVGAAGENRFVA